MPPRRRTAPAPAQIAFRAAVIIGLGANFGNQALWSASSGMPFLRNLADLAQSPAFFQIDTSIILQNLSGAGGRGPNCPNETGLGQTHPFELLLIVKLF